MNPFIKSNKLWLSLLGLAVLIVFLAFLFKPRSFEFQTDTRQSLQLITDKNLEIKVSDLAGKQLIDVRPADQFAQGHAEQAVNIPVRNLLGKESLDLFEHLKKSGQDAILYGNDESQVVAPCMLLQQMGYPNVKLLKGGFGADAKFFETTGFATETMQLDQAAMKGGQQTASPETEKKKPQPVVPVRKSVSAGGGC